MKKLNRRKLIVCSILLILFLIVMFIMLFDKKLIFDTTIYNFIMKIRSDFFDTYFTYITKFGNTLFIVVFVSIFMLLYRKKEGLLLAVSAFDSAFLTLVLKHIFLRNRPENLRLIEQGGYSFPSGHAMISVCVYGYLLYLVITRIKDKLLRRCLACLLVLLILSIGISRIYVGVHYPTDVMAGYLLGTIEVILLTEVLRLYKIRGN